MAKNVYHVTMTDGKTKDVEAKRASYAEDGGVMFFDVQGGTILAVAAGAWTCIERAPSKDPLEDE